MNKTTLIAIGAAVMPLVAATSTHADAGDTLRGGCLFNTTANAILTGGQNVGLIADLSVTQHADATPSSAIVSCWIEVNGVEAPGTRITTSGLGVQEGEALISFTASDVDVVAECQAVTFADGSTWTGQDGTNPDCPSSIPV